jgi:hypothetical protein
VATRVFNLTINAIPIVTISGDNNICIGESTTLTATGASTYTWSNGLGSGFSKTVSPTTTTIYTVTGAATNGCTSQSNITVTVNPLPIVDITTTNEVLCN